MPSLPVRIASGAVRWYLRASPLEKGKFRVWRRAAAQFLVASIDGHVWFRTSGLTDAERLLFMGQTKEPRSVQFIRDLLRPGMVTIDVGANIGYFTLIMAVEVGEHGRVHAFEPSPVLAERIRLNLSLNDFKHVRVNQHAVSARAGTAVLHISSDDFEANSLFDVMASLDQITVETTTLDSYVNQQNITSVDLIKIDCEGSELDVLKGARILLSSANAPVLVLECNPATLEACGASVSDVIAYLRSVSFACYQLEQLRRKPEPVWNILATKSTKGAVGQLISRYQLPPFTEVDATA